MRIRLLSQWLVYGLLALAVMAPMLLPGYILTLDLVFTPHIAWPGELNNTYILQVLLHVLSFVLPSDVIEKVLLGLILVLSGVGAHRLVEYAYARSGPKHKTEWLQWGLYFAGLFYMINPFTYDRFMAGQYLVLLGYALLPFFVRALLQLVDRPNLRTALLASAWATAIAWVSIHYIGKVAIVVTIAGLLSIWKYRQKLRRLGGLAKWTGLSALIVLVANSFWLVPTLSGITPIAEATAGFDQSQHEAFATAAGPLGALGNVVRLQGFWLEERGMFLLPQDLLVGWGIVMLLILTVVGIGVAVAVRRQGLVASLLGISAMTALVLAATPLIAWMSDTIPFIAGYREPQKFVGLLALAYAYFGAVGMLWLLAKLAKKSALSAQIASAVLLLVPVLSAPTMLWGFANQLTPRSYPGDWVEVNNQLINDASATKILFLPWHQYMHFDFAGRIIANPAAKFFSKPTIVSDNPEYKNASPTVPNMLNRRIEQDVLAFGNDTTHLGEALVAHGFSHVVLAKEYDFESYAYLDKQSDLKLELETENLRVYAVVQKKGLGYE